MSFIGREKFYTRYLFTDIEFLIEYVFKHSEVFPDTISLVVKLAQFP
jgi:hypothetical protein